jgi:multicomponent Na+:H+ antiporter subunit F
MIELPLFLAIALIANLLAALPQMMRGPTAADRMLAALLAGTSGVAMVLLLAMSAADPMLVDVALIFVLLSVIAGAAFVQRAWLRKESEVEHERH